MVNVCASPQGERKAPGKARGLTVWPLRPIINIRKGAAEYGQPLQCFEVIAVLVRVPAVTSFLPE